MLELFCPDLYISNIYAIDIEYIKKRNIKGLLIDLDNTLLAWDSFEVDDKLKTWVKKCMNNGLFLCILSNNRASRIKKCSDLLQIPSVIGAIKPRKKAFLKGLEILNLKREEVAVVGDQLFTDILGAKRLGMFSILVDPISDREFLCTKIMRLLERRVLEMMKKRGISPFNHRYET